jgi:hypothetical protein
MACPDCIKAWMEIQQRPVCVLCQQTWDTFDLLRFNPEFGTAMAKTYFRTLITEMSPHFTPEILAFKEMEASFNSFNRMKQELNALNKQFSTEQKTFKQDRIKQLKKDMENIVAYMNLQHQSFYGMSNGTTFVGRPFFEIIRCTQDKCIGMVDLTSPGAACVVCDNKHCTKCWVAIDDDDSHQCDDENLKAVQTILSTSRQCPTCRTIIQRSEGCPVMYCTQCKQGFDFDNGKILHGIIENPHFFQDQNRQDTDRADKYRFWKNFTQIQPVSLYRSTWFLRNPGVSDRVSRETDGYSLDLVEQNLLVTLHHLMMVGDFRSFYIKCEKGYPILFELALNCMTHGVTDEMLNKMFKVISVIHRIESYVYTCNQVIDDVARTLRQTPPRSTERINQLMQMVPHTENLIRQFSNTTLIRDFIAIESEGVFDFKKLLSLLQ